jgi:Domain of unknown function (DUF932)
MHVNSRQLEPISNDRLRYLAPSVFATTPFAGVSDKYTFIPTIDLVDRLRDEGLVPISARQSRATSRSGKEGYQKHELRFISLPDISKPLVVGGAYPSVALTNSHDTGAAFAIDAGLYRLVCSNGMMLPDSMAASLKLRHTGELGDIIEGVFTVVKDAQESLKLVDEYQAVKVARDHQLAFASAALELRESALALTPEQILRPVRFEDRNVADYNLPKPDLFTTLNVIQEHLIKGGDAGRTSKRKVMRTRAVNDIAADHRINKSLFVLAEQLRKAIG